MNIKTIIINKSEREFNNIKNKSISEINNFQNKLTGSFEKNWSEIENSFSKLETCFEIRDAITSSWNIIKQNILNTSKTIESGIMSSGKLVN